jgi:hypothetical protein
VVKNVLKTDRLTKPLSTKGLQSVTVCLETDKTDSPLCIISVSSQ